MKRKSSIRDKIRDQGKKSYKSKNDSGISFDFYLNLRDDKIQRFKDKPNSDYVIDILPYEVETENHPNREKGEVTYNLDIWVHSYIGQENGSYLCMKNNFRKPCKVCEEFLRLQNEGYEWEDIKHLYPSRRSIYNILHEGKHYIYDVSFKLFEELWLDVIEKIGKKGKDFFPIYLDEEGCTSLEFATTADRGKGKYVQFGFPEIEDYNEENKEKAISLEKLLVIPDQKRLERVLDGSSLKNKQKNKEVEEEQDEENEEMTDEEKKEYLEEAENIATDEDKEEVKIKKKKKKEKVKENNICPHEFIFGTDWDGYEICDTCLEENSDNYKLCKEKYKEMEEE